MSLPVWNLRMLTHGHRQSLYGRSFLKITLCPEEEFARNALQTGLLRYDDIPLRPISRDGMTGRRKESLNSTKGEIKLEKWGLDMFYNGAADEIVTKSECFILPAPKC